MTELTGIAFITLILLYNYTMFKYISYIYPITMPMSTILIATSIINILVYVIPQAIELGNTLPVVITLLSYTAQFRYFYKKSWGLCFFGAIVFTINMYVIGVVVASVIGYLYQSPIRIVRYVGWIKLLNTVASLGLATLQIYFVRVAFPKDKIDLLLSHKESIQLACKTLLVVFLYVVIMANIDNSQYADYTRIAVLHMKVGIMSIVGITIALAYSFMFASLNLELRQFETYELLVKQEEERITELNAIVHKDSFTDLYLRDVGMERMDFYNQHKLKYYAVFIDIDGLKFVNDTFGHNEGDYYILSVVEIIKRHFAAALISRLGGDEFLIVGSSDDVYEPTRNTLAVYGEVALISDYVVNKDYDTSVSYGIVNIDETPRLSPDEVVKLADERMYEFKKDKKKERAVKAIGRSS